MSEDTGVDEAGIINGRRDPGDDSVVGVVVHRPDGTELWCSGAVIGPRAVLTAAHCSGGDPVENPAGSTFEVRKGRTILNGVSLGLASADFDHAWKPDRALDGHDIGCLKLGQDSGLTPLLLNRKRPINAPVRIVGYGADAYTNPRTGIKNSAQTSIGQLTPQLVQVGVKKKQQWHGDSGGPAFQTIVGRERIIGLGAFALVSDMLMRDTRVDANQDFIDQCACPSGQKLCDGGCIDPMTDAANCKACGNACAAGKSCNKGQCGCAPVTCAAVGAQCGTISDGCGGTIDCGGCTLPQTCGGGLFRNQCGCTPTTCALAGAECGVIDDQCGGILFCGDCTAPDTCGVVTQNQCGCLSTTCGAAGATCGTIDDGCGHTLNCGDCTAPDTCGVSAPNQCGCIPTTCAALGANCDSVFDGCHAMLNCGTCPSPQVCGASAPNVCDTPITQVECPGTFATVPGSTLTCSIPEGHEIVGVHISVGCNDGETGTFTLDFNNGSSLAVGASCGSSTSVSVPGATSVTLTMTSGGGGDNLLSFSCCGSGGWQLDIR